MISLIIKIKEDRLLVDFQVENFKAKGSVSLISIKLISFNMKNQQLYTKV
jgi:hypothetical protein